MTDRKIAQDVAAAILRLTDRDVMQSARLSRAADMIIEYTAALRKQSYETGYHDGAVNDRLHSAQKQTEAIMDFLSHLNWSVKEGHEDQIPPWLMH